MGGQGRRGTLCVLCALLLGALITAAPASAANAIGVSDAHVTEGGGDVTATFTLTRVAGPLSGPVTVGFQTADGSATAPADYLAASGSRSFPRTLLFTETQTQTVEVTVKGDALDENDETFHLIVGGPEVTDGVGVATIADDDPAPTLSVAAGRAVGEGESNARASFTVSLSAVSGRQVSVGYTTENATATAGADYAMRSGQVVIAPGTRDVAIDVPILDDAVSEPSESFTLRLVPPATAAVLGTAVATATILDDDAPAAPPPVPVTPGQQPGQQGASPTVPLPVIGSGSPSSSPTTAPSLGLSSPRLQRPFTVLVTVSCPQGAGRCSGRITLFSVPNRHSKIKALRRERRLGRVTFTLQGGRAQTLSLGLSRTDRALLRRTGRMSVRAYAVTEDGAGRTGVRSVSGTLIARTAHSSPTRA
ncbi:MAG: large repetitive protein [Solirubrobacteraceae bacterium]|nr:large repetitive protein [Solirubrobacteraceae bacterium]